jgi:hypothetical protein
VVKRSIYPPEVQLGGGTRGLEAVGDQTWKPSTHTRKDVFAMIEIGSAGHSTSSPWVGVDAVMGARRHGAVSFASGTRSWQFTVAGGAIASGGAGLSYRRVIVSEG